MPTQNSTAENKKITPETRELLMKYFASKPPDKPLTGAEFDQVRPFIDRRRGGLTKEAYETIKDDKELVKAASISQVHRDHRVMDGRAPEVRDTLLKALQAKPGEKNLLMEEFKNVAVFLDRKNGGLRHHAFELFKNDKEVIEAATSHRAAWKLGKASAKEASQKTADKENAATKPSKLRERIKNKSAGLSSKGASKGPERGD